MTPPALQRLAALFVAPVDGAAHPARPPAASVPAARAGRRPTRLARPAAVAARVGSVAVLCPPDDAERVGGAVAHALGRGRRGAVVVCRWAPEGPSGALRAPATRGAAQLAAALVRRGHTAAAGGRAVVVALDGDPVTAAAEAVRVEAAIGDVPVALVLAGPRHDAWSASLDAQDRVLVVDEGRPDDPVAALALATVAVELGPERTGALSLPPAARGAGPAARRRARRAAIAALAGGAR